MFTARLLLGLALLAASSAAQALLNVTAIGAKDGRSTIECWETTSPFEMSPHEETAGASVAHLGDVTSLSWTVAQPGQYVGPHNAPVPQWVVLIEGIGHVALASDPAVDVYAVGGPGGLLFAADTADVSSDGHTSRYLGSTESVYLQIPTKDGQIPEHRVIHMGPCEQQELFGGI